MKKSLPGKPGRDRKPAFFIVKTTKISVKSTYSAKEAVVSYVKDTI